MLDQARTIAVELERYRERVLRPALAGMHDDGDLAVFLNDQIGRWETEGQLVAAQPLTAASRQEHKKAESISELLRLTLARLTLYPRGQAEERARPSFRVAIA